MSSSPSSRTAEDAAESSFSLRRLGVSTYLPTLLYSLGQGAIAPVVALSARELGASVGVASLVVALLGVGQLIGDLPAGALAARIGDRRAMLVAAGLAMLALAGCLLAPNVWALGIGILGAGCAAAVFGLARHSFLTEVVPYRMRARAMSTLGGVHRIGAFLGPFVGALAMRWLGTEGAYWVHLVAAAAAGGVLLLVREPASRVVTARRSAEEGTPDQPRLIEVVGQQAATLRTLGFGALLVAAVRASRQVVIPLWAERLHLDPATTSLIFGASGALDMALFYPAGRLMDRRGRAWVAVPSMLVLAVAHLLLPWTVGPASLTAVALAMGLGNGLGSGIIMTLGADAAPVRGRTTFLGAWRLCSDLGNGLGPVVISAVTAAAALGAASATMGVVGLGGALAMWRWIPRRAGRSGG